MPLDLGIEIPTYQRVALNYCYSLLIPPFTSYSSSQKGYHPSIIHVTSAQGTPPGHSTLHIADSAARISDSSAWAHPINTWNFLRLNKLWMPTGTVPYCSHFLGMKPMRIAWSLGIAPASKVRHGVLPWNKKCLRTRNPVPQMTNLS